MAKNMVVAGDYEGKIVCFNNRGLYIPINFSGSNRVMINKTTIEAYEVITEETRKSASSGIIRGAVGASLLGPVGLLAGVSAKNKGLFTVAIKFKDGKNSLIEIDDKIYKALLKECF